MEKLRLNRVLPLAIDLLVVASIVLLPFTGEPIVTFHVIFLLLIAAAFLHETQPYVTRAIPTLALVVGILVQRWQANELPSDELLELPILAAIVALVFVLTNGQRKLLGQLAKEQERLIAAEREREQEYRERLFLANRLDTSARMAEVTAHDLNTILASMIASAERASVGGGRGSPEERMDELEEAIKVAGDLVHELVQLNRRPGVDSVSDFVDALRRTHLIARQMLPPGVRLNVTSEVESALVGLPLVHAVHVVLNLVTNAIEALGPSGQIEVRLRSVVVAMPMVELTVADDGPGIPDVVRDRVEHGELAPRARGMGNGLGLYSARELVREAQGSLILERPARGGTVARVLLPVREATAVVRLMSPRHQGGSGSQRPRPSR